MVKQVKQYSPKRRHASRKKRTEHSAGRFFATVVLVICAIMLVVSYLSVLISPVTFWVPFFFGLYYVPLALLNFVLLLVAILCRSRLLLIPLVALLPSLFFSDQYFKLGTEEHLPSGDGIEVFTYNLGRFAASSSDKDQSVAAANIEKYIDELDPDVVCLQEFTTETETTAGQFLPKYPYRYHHFHGVTGSLSGNMTLSKYPIVSSSPINFKDSGNQGLVSDIEIGARTIRVFNCHLESYGIAFTSLLKKLADNNLFADEIVNLHVRMRDASRKRSEQVDIIAGQSSESPYPVIICGDFNDTPVSYVYHTLVSGLKDGFVEAGSGFSSSYSVLWPLLRIDYILVPQEYEATDYIVDRVPYSDHYPVRTSLYFQ